MSLTVRTVASRLNCSTGTVYSLIRSKQLPAFRLTNRSGHWRVEPEALDQYMRQQQERAAQHAEVA